MTPLAYALLWAVIFVVGIAGIGLIDHVKERWRR